MKIVCNTLRSENPIQIKIKTELNQDIETYHKTVCQIYYGPDDNHVPLIDWESKDVGRSKCLVNIIQNVLFQNAASRSCSRKVQIIPITGHYKLVEILPTYFDLID